MLLMHGYYVIKPNDTLTKRLTQIKSIDADLVEVLSEVVLWTHHKVNLVESHPEGDIAEIKLLFLAHLMSEYLSDGLYEELLELSWISVEVFDKWWIIERYLLDTDFADIEEKIPSTVANFFVKTGIERVDLWIDKMQNKE